MPKVRDPFRFVHRPGRLYESSPIPGYTNEGLPFGHSLNSGLSAAIVFRMRVTAQLLRRVVQTPMLLNAQTAVWKTDAKLGNGPLKLSIWHHKLAAKTGSTDSRFSGYRCFL